MKNIEAREVIAVLVVAGCFSLIGGYLFVTGGKLDSGTGVALVAFCGQPIAAIIGFYFGRTNGAATALATSATALSQQALTASTQRRFADLPAVVPPASPPTS